MSLADEAQATSELDELRAALARSQRMAMKRQVDRDELVAAVYNAARDASLAHGPAPRIVKPPRDRRKARPEVALLHLTDWQVGKRTISYDMDRARKRITEAAVKAVELTEIQRADHPVTECHVMLGGDMVEGVTIFPGQRSRWRLVPSSR